MILTYIKTTPRILSYPNQRMTSHDLGLCHKTSKVIKANKLLNIIINKQLHIANKYSIGMTQNDNKLMEQVLKLLTAFHQKCKPTKANKRSNWKIIYMKY